MVIRGPQQPSHGAPSSAHAEAGAPSRAGAPSPLQRLVDFGMARTPAEARAVLNEILTLLAARGFPVPRAGTPEQQLSASLRLLQKDAGLPQTGVLDAATARVLQDRGLAPDRAAGDARAGPATPAPPSTSHESRFTLGGPSLSAGALPRLRASDDGAAAGSASSARVVETDAARARVDASRPDVTLDLKGMLAALRAAGFAGAGRGREQLTDAVKRLQRVDGLPVTGRLDAATATALERRGVLDAATALALKEQDPTWHAPASAAASTTVASSSVSNDARTPVAGAPNEATTQGTLAPGAEDTTGRGGPPPSSVGGAGRGDAGGAGQTHGSPDDDGVVDDGDEGGDGEGSGRDVAGSDDEGTQGNANVDGADDAGEHWRAPALTEQIERALRAVRRDDDGRGPATYRFELALVRPGVYAAGQPAPELLRLVVERAGPFDPAWRRALDALNERLQRHEPDARALGDADVRTALQRARYRSLVDDPAADDGESRGGDV